MYGCTNRELVARCQPENQFPPKYLLPDFQLVVNPVRGITSAVVSRTGQITVSYLLQQASREEVIYTMRLTVDLDQLLSQNEFDPKKTAKQIALMKQEGVNLTLRVRSPNTTEVFQHLDGNRQPLRFLISWLMKPQGMFAGIGVITYVALAIFML